IDRLGVRGGELHLGRRETGRVGRLTLADRLRVALELREGLLPGGGPLLRRALARRRHAVVERRVEGGDEAVDLALDRPGVGGGAAVAGGHGLAVRGGELHLRGREARRIGPLPLADRLCVTLHLGECLLAGGGELLGGALALAGGRGRRGRARGRRRRRAG